MTDQHKQNRKLFAKKQSNQVWDDVVFSDECHFHLFAVPNRRLTRVWVNKGEAAPVQERRRKTGSVCVWGAISALGKSKLIVYRGRLKAADYQRIVKKGLARLQRRFGREGRILLFMQDNAPIHKAKTTQAFFKEHGIELLDWPAYSPDLNPIENLRAILKNKVYEQRPRTLDELERVVRKEWKAISRRFTRRLVRSLPGRLEEVARDPFSYTSH